MVNKSTVNKGEFHKILRAKMFTSVLILGHETNSFRDAETIVSSRHFDIDIATAI